MLTQELKVPNKLEELTLGQYQKFNKALSGDPDNDFLHKKTIEIFCGVDMAEVSNYKYTSITQVVGILNKMFEEKPKLINRFTHKQWMRPLVFCIERLRIAKRTNTL